MNTLKKRKDVHVVIRIHPAEVLESKESIKDYFLNLEKELDLEMVTIVDPKDSFSSYELLNLCKLALIYGSKISLEAAYREVPTIVCGNSLFKQKEFSYLPSTKLEYSTLLLDNLNKLKDQRLFSLRFAYYVYFRLFLECKWVENMLDKNTPFYKLSELDEEDIFHSILFGTQ